MEKKEKIVTRTFQYGDKCESSWPPRFGTRGSGHYYWCEETKKMVEGYPPPKYPKYGEAPAFHSDSITPYYHPRAAQWVDSKSALKKADKETGTFTTGDINLKPSSTPWTETNKILKKDRDQAYERAVAMCKMGNSHLTEEQRQLCKQEDERIKNLTGFDAANILERKGNGRKRIKRRASGN